MGRNLAAFIGSMLVTVALFGYAATSQERGYDAAACAGPLLNSEEERNAARDQGYRIHSRYNCIDRESFIAVNAQREAEERARIEAAAAAAAALAAITLPEARQGFATKISVTTARATPAPAPPANMYVQSYYTSADGNELPAFVTADPRDGYQHPAVIWLPGGDTNSPGEFWKSSFDAHRLVGALQAAGVVVMFPVLRGGHEGGGDKEFFLGEVDDVLAAADHLARVGYVNADRIYLAGHGAGATLALLTSESSARFAGVFAFGPVAEVDRYASIMPVNFREHGEQEARLRSPIHWLHGIERPTYIVEGRLSPSNVHDAEALCAKSDNPQVRCVLIDGADHVSVLDKVATVMAARLAVSDEFEFAMRAEDFNRQMLSDASAL